jgi:uncharacterized protein
VATIAGIEIDERRLDAVCERYGIAALEVFGSSARGTARPDSDIDILYTMKPGGRLGWEIEDLADELSARLGRRVDLVSRRAAANDSDPVGQLLRDRRHRQDAMAAHLRPFLSRPGCRGTGGPCNSLSRPW